MTLPPRRPFAAALMLLWVACVGGCGGHNPGGAGGSPDAAHSEVSSTIDAADATKPTSDGAARAPRGLGPPYPIVLAHGFFGFDKFAGADFVRYFFDVTDALAKDGEVNVFTPAVDPFQSSTYRGKELLKHVESIVAKTGHRKVNIIGHSQGGLDARVVAHLRPDLVASVTTIATPHGGTPLADWALKLVSTPKLQKLLDAMANLLGAPLYDAAGAQSSVVAGIKQFTKPGIDAFNAMYPKTAGVQYYSITGRTGHHIGGPACKPDAAVNFVTKFALVLDPVDPLFAVQEALLNGGLGAPFPNDGMVRAKDARFGTFLGCVPADHMDLVGHLVGDKPGLLNSWDHRLFFRELVKLLRAKSL